MQSLLDLGQQNVRHSQLAADGALKITIQQFYRPGGDSTQKRGVVADVELPALTTYYDGGEADLDYPLEFDRVAAADFAAFDDVTPAICDQLRGLSQQRLKTSKDFQKVLRKIEHFKDRKAKKYISLNEGQYLKDRAELDPDDEEKTLEKHSEMGSSDIERDYYLDEVLAITADYIGLMHAVPGRPEADQ